jgi:plastocyanin
MRKGVAVALLGVLYLWLGGPPPDAWAEKTHQVIIRDFAFKPARLTIQVGDSVEFINEDAEAHTATETPQRGFDTGDLPHKAKKTITFKKPGTYSYGCEHHPVMEAVIEVTP